MIKDTIKRQVSILQDILSQGTERKALFAILIFLVLNAVKITLFNFFMLPDRTVEVFMYKLAITLFSLFIIYPLVLRIRTRAIFITLYVLQTTYIITNLSYYVYFHSYLHLLQWLQLFKEALISATHAAVPKNETLLIAAIDIPIFLYIVIRYFNVYRIVKKLTFIRVSLIALSILVIFSVEANNMLRHSFLTDYMLNTDSGQSLIVEKYGTVVNSAVSLYMTRNEKGFMKGFSYGEKIANNKTKSEHPNFIIIQVESMDSNIIHKKYKDSYVTPYLHSLSEKSVYYPYVMSYHAAGGTSDSEFSIINSIEPLSSFPAMKLKSYNYPNSMLIALSKASYYTVALHGNVGSFYDRDTAFPKMGFMEFFDMNKMKIHEHGWGIPDNLVLDFAADKLKGLNKPYLSYIITMTSHGPYNSARNYYNNAKYDDIENKTVKEYFNSFSYVDQSLEEFVKRIKAESKNTYIFIVGDHTPSIKTDIYKQASFNKDNKYFEFVPLFIVTPDNKVLKENQRVASFLDILPTVLETSGIPYSMKSDGMNLINPDSNAKAIPFKGSYYDRVELFDMIEEVGNR